MLLSSMDHLNYYSLPKDNFLQLDTSVNDGYDLQGDDGYLNEENSPKNGTKSSLYKTELCKRFSEFGNCRYGAKCQFAHGLAELRHVVRHPKYKTTKCKSYWGSGHCPYGSRCRFIHEEVEGYNAPQYSPQGMGSMGNMFLVDKDRMGGMNGLGVPPPSDLGSSSVNSNYLYGDHHHHHHVADHMADHMGVPSMTSYQKEYSLLSSFDKSTWGSTRPAPKLNYAGDHFGTLPQVSSVPGAIGSMPLSSPTSSNQTSTNGAQPSYPDLQDAIDALMKFSLTQENESPSNAVVGTISTTPVDASSVGAAAGSESLARSASSSALIHKKDFSLESDELWKEFSSSSVPSSVDFGSSEKLDTSRWSSGLVLNLDTTKPFDVNEKKSGSGSEHSPRLSVFERFH
ncbi:Ccch-type zn-finger protein, partial [Globisporangium splendens]